ncbi:hypothetical protein HSBGL_2219 [Halapricum desulfuricans]|uniref:Uncharacterized protein n=1 Tax=Halapricum desulfuricans TaxID=2841257 RepID=A0A897NR01_9EURY|nr:hypothetical protein HSBGL_2219 [Halapricum desulfuricans]
MAVRTETRVSGYHIYPNIIYFIIIFPGVIRSGVTIYRYDRIPDRSGTDVQPTVSYWWLYVRNDIWHDGVPDQFEMG